MSLYTLRFDNYDQAKTIATALGFWNTETNKLNTRGNSIDTNGNYFGWVIDEIGQDPIISPSKYNSEGEITSQPVKATGYYVNISGQLPESQEGGPDLSIFIVPYGSGGRVFPGTV